MTDSHMRTLGSPCPRFVLANGGASPELVLDQMRPTELPGEGRCHAIARSLPRREPQPATPRPRRAPLRVLSGERHGAAGFSDASPVPSIKPTAALGSLGGGRCGRLREDRASRAGGSPGSVTWCALRSRVFTGPHRVSCRVTSSGRLVCLSGITRFDLLGDFGRFNWLGNFYIVLSYNLLFAVVTTLCLVRKFTSAVREELLKALGNPGARPRPRLPPARGFGLEFVPGLRVLVPGVRPPPPAARHLCSASSSVFQPLCVLWAAVTLASCV